MPGPEQTPYWSTPKSEKQNVAYYALHANADADLCADLALSILEKLIQTRWKILPREQALGNALSLRQEVRLMLMATGIRHFIVALIVKNASDERTLRNEKVYINKLNLVLVEVRPFHCVDSEQFLDSEARLATKLARIYSRNSCIQ
jgi:hypothetical protein